MIKVLQIGMTDNWGGIESYIMNYYRTIDKEKVQFDFINIYSNDLCFQEEIISLGGKIYNVSSYYRHPIKYIKEVKKIIKENDYKIIHCNMNSAVFLYPLIAAKFAKAKTIISHSHNSSSDKGILKTILHAINKHFIPFFANTYFACSNKAGEWFYNKKVRKSGNYFVIKNAINTIDYQFDEKMRNSKRKELNIEENTLVLGHVGRFNKQKNHSFLLNLFDELQRKCNNSKLLLIGVGPLKKEIEEKIKKLHLEDKVLCLGQRKDVPNLMQAMDLFLLPSLYEGLPLVGVEAQTSNLPCLFSDTITKEISINKKVSFLSLKEPLSEWIEEILKLSKEKRKNDISEIINAGYEIKSSCEKLIQIYTERDDFCGKGKKII